MKTAMQKLISELKCIDDFPMVYGIIKRAEHYLEKEKEQICNAYTDGLEGPYIGSEEYYNQTYNQEETLEEWKSKFTLHCAIKPKNKQS